MYEPGKIEIVIARVLVVLSPAALFACTPEPASTVEMRQTVVEWVEQGRVMRIEDAMTGLVGTIARGDTLPAIADAVAADLASEVACAKVMRVDDVALKITFGAPGSPCVVAGVEYVGGLEVVYSHPTRETLLATLSYEALQGDETELDGFTQLTWDEEGVERVVTEIRIDSVTARAMEIQSDRLVARTAGQLKIEGWRRWQTLMGRWEMELAGLQVMPEEVLPVAGIGSIDTPFNHTITLDFSSSASAREAGAQEVRVGGGRRDRIFAVTAAGEVIDRGEG